MMAPVEKNGAALRVLVVEDSAIGREVLARALPRIGAEVTWALNGSEAVKAAEREAFDVVLMDLRMPGMDGLAATREIRAIEGRLQRPRAPVIVVSAHATAADRAATAEAGADLHLAKPYDVPALLGAIQGMTERL
jgi:two-component system, sensor histidine kinase